MGNGSIEDALRPVRIPISANSTEGNKSPQFIVSMNVGYRHTMVLSSSQLLFAWGMVNLTNATEAEVIAAPAANLEPGIGAGGAGANCNQSVQSSLPSSQVTPSNADSRRRFSVFCDASSTSELYLTPTQVLYSSRAQNPFSDGRFLALRGSSSSSLGFVTIDAEVSLALPTSPTASTARGPSATGAILRSGASVEGSKLKLKTAATAVRAAMLFSSPTSRTTPNKADDLTVSDSSSVAGKSTSFASPKPKFNPFLKDHSSKKEEQVRSVFLVLAYYLLRCVHFGFLCVLFIYISRRLWRSNSAKP